MPERDPKAALIAVVAEGGWNVSGDIPGDIEERLPYVAVNDLPAGVEFQTWQGGALRWVSRFDCYALAATEVEAGDVARAVAALLDGVHDWLDVTLSVTPHSVVEFNPAIRRSLFTVEARYRR